MTRDGIGWPATYFIFGCCSGANAMVGAVAIAAGAHVIAVISCLMAVAGYVTARHIQRPLFSEDEGER
jgi:hypothetical protein